MREHLWWITLSMAIVTYLPRMLPLVILHKVKLPAFIKRQFEFIPYAVLSALIFPGILSSTGHLSSAVFGGCFAVLLAFLRLNLFLIVVCSITAVYLWEKLS